jgi:hypothetical protein
MKIEILNVHIQVVVDAKSHNSLDVRVLCIRAMDGLPVDLEVDLVRVLLRVNLEEVARVALCVTLLYGWVRRPPLGDVCRRFAIG